MNEEKRKELIRQAMLAQKEEYQRILAERARVRELLDKRRRTERE